MQALIGRDESYFKIWLKLLKDFGLNYAHDKKNLGHLLEIAFWLEISHGKNLEFRISNEKTL